jgi:hypothetical protein
MNLFCLFFGHTFLPETRSPLVRWNTTKDGHILVPTIGDDEVVHVEVCRRCGLERAAEKRRHDDDRPAVTAALAGGAEEESAEE